MLKVVVVPVEVRDRSESLQRQSYANQFGLRPVFLRIAHDAVVTDNDLPRSSTTARSRFNHRVKTSCSIAVLLSRYLALFFDNPLSQPKQSEDRSNISTRVKRKKRKVQEIICSEMELVKMRIEECERVEISTASRDQCCVISEKRLRAAEERDEARGP